MSKKYFISIALIAAVTLLRILIAFFPQDLVYANFSSVAAVAILSAAYLKGYRGLGVSIASMLISDVVLSYTVYSGYNTGFLYSGWHYTYLALVLMYGAAALGMRKVTPVTFLLTSLTAVLIHWLVSDFGVWFHNPVYTQDFSGYFTCLINAIPFEIRFLAGTLFYGSIMFLTCIYYTKQYIPGTVLINKQ